MSISRSQCAAESALLDHRGSPPPNAPRFQTPSPPRRRLQAAKCATKRNLCKAAARGGPLLSEFNAERRPKTGPSQATVPVTSGTEMLRRRSVTLRRTALGPPGASLEALLRPQSASAGNGLREPDTRRPEGVQDHRRSRRRRHSDQRFPTIPTGRAGSRGRCR